VALTTPTALRSWRADTDGASLARLGRIPGWLSTRRVGWLPALPFAAIALAGQILSAVGAPSDALSFWLSTLLLVVSVAVLAIGRIQAIVVAACLYVASVGFLMLANGGISSGVGTLFFVAVVGVALYGRRRESIVVVGLVVVMLFIVSATSPLDPAVLVRRLGLFCGIAGVLSVSIHALRGRLVESNEQTVRLLHQAQALNGAAKRLAALIDPAGIAALGAELGAQIASPPGTAPSQARYLRIDGVHVVTSATFGGPPETLDAPEALRTPSPLSQVVRTHQPLTGLVASAASVAVDPDTYGAWVPVCLRGELHGVLEVTSPGAPVSADCLERVMALGHLLELALSNWEAHEELERRATAEERRRIARDLHDGLAHELAFIASKARGTGTGPNAREVASAADRALDEARRAITVLSSSEPQSLTRALTQTAEDLGARLGVPVLLDLDKSFDVPPPVAEQLLRVVREAITNAAVHGRPRAVTITLQADDDARRLVIGDDGCGFDPAESAGRGFGLVSMRERAASIGAGFDVRSAPGLGTRIAVVLP
jgi:signal transduction histidine kinase